MDKKEIFNHFSSIIDELLKTSMFFEAYFQRPWFLDSHISGEIHEELPSNISIHDGATKACIIDYDYDWVIKFDIDDDIEFGSACKRELKLYNKAKRLNLDSYFTEPIFLGTYQKKITFYDIDEIEQYCDWSGYDAEEFDEEIMKNEEYMTIKEIVISIPLYAYRRANLYNYKKLDDSFVNSAKKIYSPLRERNVAVAAAFIQEYGYEQYKNITNFMCENDINDIHLGNIGEVDGHLIITDWNGYHK